MLIHASPENADRLIAALLDAKLGTAALTSSAEILANEITVFQDRVRIDVQTVTPGLTFADAWAHRVSMTYQGQLFFVISKQTSWRRNELPVGQSTSRTSGCSSPAERSKRQHAFVRFCT